MLTSIHYDDDPDGVSFDLLIRTVVKLITEKLTSLRSLMPYRTAVKLSLAIITNSSNELTGAKFTHKCIGASETTSFYVGTTTN